MSCQLDIFKRVLYTICVRLALHHNMEKGGEKTAK